MSRHCKSAARLLSESLDRALPLRKRLFLWYHLVICRLCRNYSRDFKFLREQLRKRDQETIDSDLSDEAKSRLKKLLEDE